MISTILFCFISIISAFSALGLAIFVTAIIFRVFNEDEK